MIIFPPKSHKRENRRTYVYKQSRKATYNNIYQIKTKHSQYKRQLDTTITKTSHHTNKAPADRHHPARRSKQVKSLREREGGVLNSEASKKGTDIHKCHQCQTENRRFFNRTPRSQGTSRQGLQRESWRRGVTIGAEQGSCLKVPRLQNHCTQAPRGELPPVVDHYCADYNCV